MHDLAVNDPVFAFRYKDGMTTRPSLPLLITLALVFTGGSVFAQSYPPPAYPPGYRLPPLADDGPDFDAVDDDVLPPPGLPPRAMPLPEEPRYGRAPGPAVTRGYEEPRPVGRAPGFIYPDDPSSRPPVPPREVGRAPGAGAPVATGSTPASASAPGAMSLLPPEDQPETGAPKELAPNLKRQEVPFAASEPVGTIVVDTTNTYLYYVLGNGRAIRYGIRVGRDGFRWSGVQKITKKVEWPDWHPPSEMIERQPYLPRFMAGGPGNPLGARALYLGNTVYRIHGTNQPSTIGKRVSSGCFGLLNEDVEDLYERVKPGTRVVVLPGVDAPATASTAPSSMAPAPRSAGGGAVASEPLHPMPRTQTR